MSWSLLLAALACLAIVVAGVALVAAGSGPIGWAMIGFFGAGVVVLGKKAIGR
ncbi:hypothetical protein [Nocardioides sp. SR21]|uniref:hypothetical protein n=1 Tax=Nocardioides sp. SR21 TaxID=2919501 RepID=UPI001FAAC21F|nr:hypothetical protein [Nocardioides sp. SR21]